MRRIKICSLKFALATANALIVIGYLLCAIVPFTIIGMYSNLYRLEDFIPRHIELPISSSSNALSDSKKNHYVVMDSYDRIQVYNKDKKFLYGWFYESDGGNRKINFVDDSIIQIVTIREKMLYLYNKNGMLIRKGKYAPQSYDSFQCSFYHIFFYDTPFYFEPFAMSGGEMFFVVIAMILFCIAKLIKGLLSKFG